MAENSQIKASEVVTKTLDKLAADPNVNLSEASADKMKSAVTKEMTSVIVNQTNQEPWYQSRVTWGAILAGVSGALAVFGYQLPAEVQGKILDGIIAAGPLVSMAVVLYGRWVAKKPIGE